MQGWVRYLTEKEFVSAQSLEYFNSHRFFPYSGGGSSHIRQDDTNMELPVECAVFLLCHPALSCRLLRLSPSELQRDAYKKTISSHSTSKPLPRFCTIKHYTREKLGCFFSVNLNIFILALNNIMYIVVVLSYSTLR